MSTSLNRESYFASHCWQYDIRLKNLETDLKQIGLTKKEAEILRVSDFEIQFVPKTDKEKCNDIVSFIERHEWLGKMPTRPTHRFIATYKGYLAGVIVMATPNSISDLLGKENRHREKLISRGACISWSPKNLASALVMFSIRWMVRHTEFRYFTAYSDVEARELGTIYQACNFTYLGQTSGARFECIDPSRPEQQAFSDRLFRRASFIKRKSLEAGFEWDPSWNQGEKLLWEKIPSENRFKIEQLIRSYQASCVKRPLPHKHKYVYVLGCTKSETKNLRAIFERLNPDKPSLKYPKERVPVALAVTDTATQSSLARPCRISPPELTTRPNPCWPLNNKESVSPKKFYSIKEVVSMYGISSWLIYHHIKTDPTFPVINAGVKKRFLIEPARFEAWLEHRTTKFKQLEHGLLSAENLLAVRS
jgi:hypothetical protein